MQHVLFGYQSVCRRRNSSSTNWFNESEQRRNMLVLAYLYRLWRNDCMHPSKVDNVAERDRRSIQARRCLSGTTSAFRNVARCKVFVAVTHRLIARVTLVRVEYLSKTMDTTVSRTHSMVLCLSISGFVLHTYLLSIDLLQGNNGEERRTMITTRTKLITNCVHAQRKLSKHTITMTPTMTGENNNIKRRHFLHCSGFFSASFYSVITLTVIMQAGVWSWTFSCYRKTITTASDCLLEWKVLHRHVACTQWCIGLSVISGELICCGCDRCVFFFKTNWCWTNACHRPSTPQVDLFGMWWSQYIELEQRDVRQSNGLVNNELMLCNYCNDGIRSVPLLRADNYFLTHCYSGAWHWEGSMLTSPITTDSYPSHRIEQE